MALEKIQKANDIKELTEEELKDYRMRSGGF